MLNQALLNEFRLDAAEKQLGVYGIHVWQNGEELTHRWRSDDEVCLYSGSKTFTSVACGMCQDEGRLKLDDCWLDYFPHLKSVAAPGTERQTLRALLHMQSGKHENIACFFDGTETDVLEDWAKAETWCEPGTRFDYVNTCTYTVARVVEQVSGVSLREYLMPRLFKPLNIPNPQWHTDSLGHTLGFSGLYLHTGDFAKIGRLMLQNGAWDGKQLVSEAYVNAMREDTVDNSNWSDEESRQGYGYQVWRCTADGCYRADGMYGQFSMVCPKQNAVVTVTSHNERCPNDILRAIERDILPKL